MNSWRCPKCGAIATNDRWGWTYCETCGYNECAEMMKKITGINTNKRDDVANREDTDEG